MTRSRATLNRRDRPHATREARPLPPHPTRRTSVSRASRRSDRFSTRRCSTGGSAKSRRSRAPTRTATGTRPGLRRAPRAAIMTWKRSKKRSCARRFERLCNFAAAGLELGVNYAKYFLSQLKRGKIEPNGTSSASTHSVPVRREFVMYNKGEESCGSYE